MAWTTVSAYSATTWTGATSNSTIGWPVTGPVSVETRVNRIYPQVDQLGHVPFIYQITSNPGGDFFVARGSRVYIQSSYTDQVY